MQITQRKPSWFKVPLSDKKALEVHRMMDEFNLHTVCREARCPNIGECFSRRTATFLILGDVCSRNCSFCTIKSGKPLPVDEDEPKRAAEAAKKLGLKHVVITGVNRDDLPLGGAEQYAKTVEALRKINADLVVEILPGDFGGEIEALEIILENPPDVFNHNLETVKRLTPLIRDRRADYATSLKVLKTAKEMLPGLLTKSGIILGLGEEFDEIIETMRDLREVDCDGITIGQYIAPSKEHHPVVKYYTPDEFRDLENVCRDMGFRGVASGPLVRSSYNAAGLFDMRWIHSSFNY